MANQQAKIVYQVNPSRITDSSGNILQSTDGALNVYVENSSGSSLATTPTIFNVTVALANQEMSQSLPVNTKKFFIKVRNATSSLKFAFSAGATSTDYISLNRGFSYSSDNVLLASTILYFQTDVPAQVVEILAWV
jgi:hypothetical protein